MPSATNTLLAIGALLTALAGAAYQLHFKSIADALGIFGRNIEARNNVACDAVPELTACEKIVLHQPSGNIFAACSTPESRVAWTPALERLNASARSTGDFIAIFDPATDMLRRFTLSGFTDPRGLNVHGMDVIQSSSNPAEFWVYAVNQRPPLDGMASERVAGPKSSVEVFRLAALTASALEHVATVDASPIISPNDVVGSADGTHFWFTNDGSHARGLAALAQVFLKSPADNSVGFCRRGDANEWACKIAADRLHGSNGIARSGDTFYVANHFLPQIHVLERQADDTLALTDVVATEQPADNISIDQDGGIWSATMPLQLDRIKGHFANSSIPSPSAAFRMALNTGRSAFFGEKYALRKVFEDNGTVASGITTAAYDMQRGRLFLSGLSSPTIICDVRPSKVKPMEDWSEAATSQ